MDIKKVDPQFSCSAQINVDDVDALIAHGVRSIICTRPDEEEPGQPAFDDIAQNAREKGLVVFHVPVIPGQITDSQVKSFQDAWADMPQPVHGYCRTGTRAVVLWALAGALNGKEINELIHKAAEAGYDIAHLRERMVQLQT